VSDLDAQVLALVREATGNATAADPLADGGFDSVAMVRLLAGVEDAFALTVPPADITAENFASVPALSALVQRLRA
jgi:methoxymalonate biosynthesis acyl carrier protein